MDFFVNEPLLAGRSARVRLSGSGIQVAMVENAGRFHWENGTAVLHALQAVWFSSKAFSALAHQKSSNPAHPGDRRTSPRRPVDKPIELSL